MPALSGTQRGIRDAIVVGIVMLFLWLTIRVDLVIFTGILFAIFLRTLATLLGRHAKLPITVALPLVMIGIVVIVGALAWLFAARIDGQIGVLSQKLPPAIAHWKKMVQALPVIGHLVDSDRLASDGGFGRLFGAATTTVDVLAMFAVSLAVGIYGAIDSGLYRRAFLLLVPPAHRARAANLFAEVSLALWFWMIGRLFSMAVIGIATGIGLWLVGIPVPATLGLLAGVLNAVPYVGTVVSAVPAVLLAVTISPSRVVYVILVFVGIHTLEGYILIPLVQKRAAQLPPALLIGTQAVLWALVGLPGIALAAPILAAVMILVGRLYVEDVLGDKRGIARHVR